MVPYDRFTVVLDACKLLPVLARDVLLTLAAHEFLSPKWSARIRDGSCRPCRCNRYFQREGFCRRSSERAIADRGNSSGRLHHGSDRSQRERAVAAFRELRARKKNPPWTVDEIVKRLQTSGLVQTSLWLNTKDVAALM